MAVIDAVAQEILGIIAAVEDNDGIPVDAEGFKVFEVVKGSGTFGSKVAAEGSVDDIIVNRPFSVNRVTYLTNYQLTSILSIDSENGWRWL